MRIQMTYQEDIETKQKMVVLLPHQGISEFIRKCTAKGIKQYEHKRNKRSSRRT